MECHTAVTSKAKATAPARGGKKVIKSNSDDEDDEESWHTQEQAKRDVELEAKYSKKDAPAPSRARGAARKAVNYGVDSDSSDVDGFEVGDMIRSYGAASAAPSRSLFAETASASRPSSSHSVTKPRKIVKSDSDDDMDSTNYAGLAAGSPAKQASRARDFKDEDDDHNLLSDGDSDVPVRKPKAAAPKPPTKAAVATKLVEKPKKATYVPPVFPTYKAKKLSPAGKAYEKKIERARAGATASTKPPAQPKFAAAAKKAPAKKKRTIESDEDDDDLADAILSDEDDDAPAPARTDARPSRRAAAAPKGRYVADDDDEDSIMKDESEEEYSEAEDDDE